MKRGKTDVRLMKTVFRMGKTFVLNDFEGIPRSIAIKQAFEQMKGLNISRSSDEFFWVKLTY